MTNHLNFTVIRWRVLTNLLVRTRQTYTAHYAKLLVRSNKVINARQTSF